MNRFLPTARLLVPRKSESDKAKRGIALSNMDGMTVTTRRILGCRFGTVSSLSSNFPTVSDFVEGSHHGERPRSNVVS